MSIHGGLAPGNRFRGSAAFFAMLVAASSGLAQDGPAMDSVSPDRLLPTAPQAARTQTLRAASKFTRRRQPLTQVQPRG